MKRPLAYSVVFVTAVHIGLVVLVGVVTGWRPFATRPEEVTIPVEFMVEALAPTPVETPEADVEAAAPEEVPSPEPERRPIQVSRRKVRRRVGPPPPERRTPRLSDEEIRRLLAQGAELGDRTSIPDEDARSYRQIRDVLYRAWAQPSAEAAGDAVAEVRLHFAPDGRITSFELVGASGNALLDASVREAVASVPRVGGLTSSFLERHDTITVSFRVE